MIHFNGSFKSAKVTRKVLSFVNAAKAIQNGTGLEDLVDYGGASAMHGCQEQPRIQT